MNEKVFLENIDSGMDAPIDEKVRVWGISKESEPLLMRFDDHAQFYRFMLSIDTPDTLHFYASNPKRNVYIISGYLHSHSKEACHTYIN